ncbi:uncharacterized protein EV420DRAFT_1578180 [Desarmillaria tabescens]|uniref:Uncharacterized protein n=1 Tax=Armillaria tabescens TaxID=1929756 RepID=A0AA39JIN8_ARMTA|nr:uncharacterized protein EV420DRAFT_1578180 [Desarmillaria tabescens]KAK0442481.1 hypothetical protein EV420DRAFT_1578180 [Desarmillaria tabescens]
MSDAEIVWTQILQSIGGGMGSVMIQVGAQASVLHIDVAMVTAVALLLTEIGGATGSDTGAFCCVLYGILCVAKCVMYLFAVPLLTRVSECRKLVRNII